MIINYKKYYLALVIFKFIAKVKNLVQLPIFSQHFLVFQKKTQGRPLQVAPSCLTPPCSNWSWTKRLSFWKEPVSGSNWLSEETPSQRLNCKLDSKCVISFYIYIMYTKRCLYFPQASEKVELNIGSGNVNIILSVCLPYLNLLWLVKNCYVIK